MAHELDGIKGVLLPRLATLLRTDPELSLMHTNCKFMHRFTHVEERVKASGREWESFSLEELDALWNEAKGEK